MQLFFRNLLQFENTDCNEIHSVRAKVKFKIIISRIIRSNTGTLIPRQFINHIIFLGSSTVSIALTIKIEIKQILVKMMQFVDKQSSDKKHTRTGLKSFTLNRKLRKIFGSSSHHEERLAKKKKKKFGM